MIVLSYGATYYALISSRARRAPLDLTLPDFNCFLAVFLQESPQNPPKKILHYTGASGSRSLLNKFKSQVIPREPLKFKDVIKQKIRKISIWNFFFWCDICEIITTVVTDQKLYKRSFVYFVEASSTFQKNVNQKTKKKWESQNIFFCYKFLWQKKTKIHLGAKLYMTIIHWWKNTK